MHDLGIRKTTPPQIKYNGAQKIAYSAIVIMGIGSVITGLAIYKPVQFSWLCSMVGGYESARIIHFILTLGYCLFFVIHILQVIRAGWRNFSSMVTGFDVLDEKGTAEKFPIPRLLRTNLYLLASTSAICIVFNGSPLC